MDEKIYKWIKKYKLIVTGRVDIHNLEHLMDEDIETFENENYESDEDHNKDE